MCNFKKQRKKGYPHPPIVASCSVSFLLTTHTLYWPPLFEYSTMSIASDGVHMQYSSPPHQHEPGRSWAGCPPCQVCSRPWHDAVDDNFSADFKAVLADSNLANDINTTTNIVMAAMISKDQNAMLLCCLRRDALFGNIMFNFVDASGRLGPDADERWNRPFLSIW